MIQKKQILFGLILVFVCGSANQVRVVNGAPKIQNPPPWAEAKKRILKGNYQEGRTLLSQLEAKEPHLGPQLARLRLLSFLWEGKLEEANKLFPDMIKKYPEDAGLAGLYADHLYRRGDWDEADKWASVALKLKENELTARWTIARILRDRGKIKEADQAFRWVVRHYSTRSFNDDDITDPEELLIVAECGAENARWNKLSRQFSFILNEVLKDALKADPDFWPAELLAGWMLLEKYNRPDALEAFDKALKINPKLPEAFVGKGEAALVKFDVDQAEAMADQALKLSADHPGALRLKAEIHLIAMDYAGAEKFLVRALRRAPRDERLLGKWASTLFLQNKLPEFNDVLQKVQRFSSTPGLFYSELAASLEDRKRTGAAEKYYQKAIELRPNLAAPQSGLGLLYLRIGDEKKGREILEQSFKADPFNVRVINSLRVLKHLEQYSTVESEHYILRFDPKKDQILAGLLLEYLEKVHDELQKQYDYQPPGKTLVEIFNSHEMFSGRTVGLPDLHTIGACTGRVVALASPTATGVRKPYNWGRVIRHELTHIFNLAQTDFQCPHWLTEGLAVEQEEMDRPHLWSQILRKRYHAKQLLDLKSIMFGFIRPKALDEWTLAYCQAQLYVQYLRLQYGDKALAGLLQSFAQGHTTEKALRDVCQVSLEDFEKGYLKYLAQIVEKYPLTDANNTTELTFDELVKASTDNPSDLQLKARLAEEYLKRNKPDQARTIAEAVLKKQADHPLACLVLSRILLRLGKKKEARDLIATAVKRAPVDPRLLLSAAKLSIQLNELDSAVPLLEKGRKQFPLEGDWLDQLAAVYRKMKKPQEMISVLREICAHDPDNLKSREELAEIYNELENYPLAEKWAFEALMIDVTSGKAVGLFLDALEQQNKNAERERYKKILLGS